MSWLPRLETNKSRILIRGSFQSRVINLLYIFMFSHCFCFWKIIKIDSFIFFGYEEIVFKFACLFIYFFLNYFLFTTLPIDVFFWKKFPIIHKGPFFFFFFLLNHKGPNLHCLVSILFIGGRVNRKGPSRKFQAPSR